MKILLIFSLLFSISAFAETGETEVLLRLEIKNSSAVFITGKKSKTMGTDQDPSFQNLLAVINGKAYQISNKSDPQLLYTLCAPFKTNHPFVYNSAETKGFFKKVVFIDSNLQVRGANTNNSEDEVVISTVTCMKERY